MKLILITFLLLLASCTTSPVEYKEEKEVQITNWHTWNARYVSKTVDGDITCYSHSEGGIQCFNTRNEIK